MQKMACVSEGGSNSFHIAARIDTIWKLYITYTRGGGGSGYRNAVNLAYRDEYIANAPV